MGKKFNQQRKRYIYEINSRKQFDSKQRGNICQLWWEEKQTKAWWNMYETTNNIVQSGDRKSEKLQTNKEVSQCSVLNTLLLITMRIG